jgi:hypothetical protein
MPLLSTEYISKWYYLEDLNNTNNIVLVQTCTQNLITSAESNQLITGHAGSMSITPSQYDWSTSLMSPVLVINNIVPSDSRTHKDLFTFVKEKYDYLLNHLKNGGDEFPLDSSHLMKKFTIKIENDVEIDTELIGNLGSYFNNTLAVDNEKYQLSSKDFIARTVKFYDVNFYVNGTQLKLLTADITGSFEYSKNYFINSMTSMPFYGVNFFRLNGKFELLIPVSEWTNFSVIEQEYNALFAEQANVSIQIQNEYLNLGQINLKNSLTYNLNGGLTTVSVTFETYARYRE